MTGEAPGQPATDRTPPAPAASTFAVTGPAAAAVIVAGLPGPAGPAGIEAEDIRGARPADMITAPGWRGPRLAIPSRGPAGLPGVAVAGASRQARDLTAPVPGRACPAL